MTEAGIQVKTIEISKELYYKNERLLSMKIKYPQFYSPQFQVATIKMNAFYKTQALAYEMYCKQVLFKTAVEQYYDAVEMGYPVREFEAYLSFKITYNKNCTLSMYFDRYEYTGGAHGSITRSAYTWNLQYGRRLGLSQMIEQGTNYKGYCINYINSQIAQQIKNGENAYFDDYEKNVEKTFDPKNFYLTGEGVVLYFPQYAIAPYASGILEFTIPYGPGSAVEPACK
jgi:hypothetical protein